ncbi:hypothetical protein ACX12E_11935 [Paenibacillus vandeheii]
MELLMGQSAFFSAQAVLKRKPFCYIWQKENAKLIQNPGKWVMYTEMPYWNHLGTKLHKNDANSRCDPVDFVL